MTDQLQPTFFLFVSHQGETKDIYKYVKVKIERNWGHPEYTCLYNFQVHGKTSDEYYTQDINLIWSTH